MRLLFSTLVLAGALSTLAPAPHARADVEPFIGQLMPFGGNFCPRNWARADGQILSINQNQALFALLGTTYGGNGRTTFRLPDLRGRVAIHQGQGPGLTPYQLGERGGRETVVLTTGNMPSHGHTLRASGDDGDADDPSGAALGVESENHYDSSADLGATMHPNSIGNTGNNGAINIVNPQLGIHWCIALQGLFPSRS